MSERIPKRKVSSRKRIINAALSLFSANGITATTTKEIAEKAGVNEVTLFRQFGSKQGLLLSVIQEAPLIKTMQVALSDIPGANNPIKAYSSASLELLEQVPQLLRSLIGESGQAPPENHQALAQTLFKANQQTVGYLRGEQFNQPELTVEESAKLLNTLLIGYALISTSSGGQTWWQGQSNFLEAVDKLFTSTSQSALVNSTLANHQTQNAIALAAEFEEDSARNVMDLPAETVRSLFQKAKKHSPQAYALVYVLFGAGLRIEECAALQKPQVLASKTQHLLTITGPHARQVPVNRWIMGHRYGTYLKNPLTQWIKSRTDEQPAVFISEDREPLCIEALLSLWNEVVEYTELYAQPKPFHARQTWCVELLSKGIDSENLSLLSGLSLEELSPYEKRTREKSALEAAIAIDQKNA